MILLLKVADPG